MSKRVALGIAHTESKPGASTPDKKIYENAYSRELCMMIYDELYRQTPMTEAFIIERPEPNDISGEIEAVNSIENLSCYIAFHANAFNGHIDGCEMLHYKGVNGASTLQNYCNMVASPFFAITIGGSRRSPKTIGEE